MADRQLITALDKLEKLTPYKGLPVLSVGIEIPGIGGGLRDALTVDPVEYDKGDTVFVLVEGVVEKFHHDPVKDAEGWKLVHILKVENAAIVNRDDVEDLIEAHRLRIEAAKGIERLPFRETDEELHEAHQRGDHAAGLVDDCIDCDEEVRAMHAEEGTDE